MMREFAHAVAWLTVAAAFFLAAYVISNEPVNVELRGRFVNTADAR